MASRFITCGMYAFTPRLREAWQLLFDAFLRLIEQDDEIEPALRFEAGFDLLRHPDLFIGHTCGYPLMKYLHQECEPVCVPVFDVEGCDGKYYSSRFIVPAESEIAEICQCHTRVAAFNGQDSNSGMNVLRHAVAQCGKSPPFFSSLVETGSHLNSLRAVAESRADIAAIDCVSYALIQDEWPELTGRVKTLGFSAQTCALPLVIPVARRNQDGAEMYTRLLNEALSTLSKKQKNTLRLARFEEVVKDDYRGIIELELEAEQREYSVLS